MSKFKTLKPTRQAITVAGRRVEINPLNYRADLVVNEALESDDQVRIAMVFADLIRNFVTCNIDLRDEKVYNNQIYLAEETDLVYLLRWASFSTIAPFMVKCGACEAEVEQSVETRMFQRRLYECANDECACHAINKEMDEEINALNESDEPFEWDNIAWAEENWHHVPEDHLTEHPKSVIYKTDRYEATSDLSISCRAPMVSMRVGMTQKKNSIGITKKKGKTSRSKIKALARGGIELIDPCAGIIEHINWPSDDLIEVSDPKRVVALLKEMPREMLLDIVRVAARFRGGIDNSIMFSCPSCGEVSRRPLPFDRSFTLGVAETSTMEM